MKLSYQLWPTQAGDSILFLHGMGGTGKLWRPIAVQLEDRFSVLAVDQRGHGGSLCPSNPAQPPRYSPLDYGKDVMETVQDLGFHPAWVVGHSMGVRTACAFAHLKPDWVLGLVLVDLGFSGPAGGGLGDRFSEFLKKLPTSFTSRHEMRLYLEKHCPDASIGQYLMAVSAPGSSFPFDKEALIQTIEATRGTSIRGWIEELAKKNKPILVLRGAQSSVWPHGDFAQEQNYFKNYSSIKFEEVPDTGHGLPFEKRKEFVARLEDFIQANR